MSWQWILKVLQKDSIDFCSEFRYLLLVENIKFQDIADNCMTHQLLISESELIASIK